MNTSWSDLELDVMYATVARLVQNYSDYDPKDELAALPIRKALAETVKTFSLKDDEGKIIDLPKEFAHPTEYFINTIKSMWLKQK